MDSCSAVFIANKVLALGTHNGFIHILDLKGTRIKSFKPHKASVLDIRLDATAEFVATASMDGQIVIHSLTGTESYAFDLKRPIRTMDLEPHFAKRSSRAFVCGGMAESLILREKSWLGHTKETVLHTGEGPIWHVRWRDRLIAWANDLGVKIYDTVSQSRITYIDRPEGSPRADLFKCTLHWQDDSTLLIAWADHIKVARIRARPRNPAAAPPSTAGQPPLIVEITAVFQLDCMVSGIVPHPTPGLSPMSDAASRRSSLSGISAAPPALTSLLVLAYSPPDTSYLTGDERTDDRAQQARKAAERPELRIISRAGEELTADALSVADFHLWGCNDYVLAEVDGAGAGGDDDDAAKWYAVMSPRDIVLVKPRDGRDHVAWLLERKRYEEALDAIEKIQPTPGDGANGELDAVEVGQRYIEHLVAEGSFAKAARLCPKVCGQDAERWERWIWVFAERKHLHTIIPFVPTEAPKLGHVVYEMMLGHFLTHDRQALLQMIKEWPKDIYDLSVIIVAVQSTLDRAPSSSSVPNGGPAGSNSILMECLAELYTANRQPGKALPFYLRLRRANVFDLIREHNLYMDVQDQALLLVDFDHELMEKRKTEGLVVYAEKSEAIQLLVDHIHSIPIARVEQQLNARPYYLFLYLDALMAKDPNLVFVYADRQVELFAEFATPRLIDFLRASNYYNLEKAYKACKERDLVTEMVFLLGRMGNNQEALTLIIERLGDVSRAIEFAKEQRDEGLWERLLQYSETRPAFIRGLLENVGAEINPIRLIRRIKNGLEIPGLKEALIKILHDFHLQISLLEGCQTILNGDSSDLARQLQKDQTSGFFLTAKAKCPICLLPLQQSPQALVLLFLCRHVVHATCCTGGDDLPPQLDPVLASAGMGGNAPRGLSGKIAFASVVRAKIDQGCPVCHLKAEGASNPRT
ncbi:vacuolar protein sorting-associated protein 41 [Athelia psychrophila]|uniref:Vacuolar protein sorting-associated protein 41 n=1 Tax=Athelia psychrophila TaxID=1759441 RepID=A0A167UXJ7_9AGAM|nr:vacuolar protein sorting-associated protein 41 [Fibularhizoctonia sp. CBS 109695]